jgi:hypothetical protein
MMPTFVSVSSRVSYVSESGATRESLENKHLVLKFYRCGNDMDPGLPNAVRQFSKIVEFVQMTFHFTAEPGCGQLWSQEYNHEVEILGNEVDLKFL